MPRAIRFHLDENCNRAIADGLKRLGVDATTTTEAALIHASDEEQIAFALERGRVIFTQDRDFLRLHAAGAVHAGIAYCDKDRLSIGDIISGLVLLWEVYDPDDMAGRVEFLTPHA